MNTQNSILLIDPSFDLSNSANCSLLVRVGIDSFSYAILDKESNTVSAVFDEQECSEVVNKLSERLKNDPYLGLTFNEIKLAIYTENNVSVPNSLFIGDDLKLNTTFFSEPHSENIYTTAHPNFGFTSVFSFSKMTDEIIHRSFLNSKKYQPHVALLKLAENSADTSLLVDFTAGAMYVLYLKQKQVIFQHDYEIENAEEFNYYLLLMINQFGINLNDTEVYLSGIIHKNDDKYIRLTNYFNSTQFLDCADFNLNMQILEDMPSHYYTTLLTLNQCV
ncbi:DUF3822 family protein [Pedobacter sp. Du54]|uniref:DUF3822 family protein n=1 Tax=Pedobacter anseongensis TaxID=3133439 RepID=UPI00309485CD